MAAATTEFSVVLPDNWLPLDVTGEQRIADEVERCWPAAKPATRHSGLTAAESRSNCAQSSARSAASRL